jgi:hypothetical protein
MSVSLAVTIKRLHLVHWAYVLYDCNNQQR